MSELLPPKKHAKYVIYHFSDDDIYLMNFPVNFVVFAVKINLIILHFIGVFYVPSNRTME